MASMRSETGDEGGGFWAIFFGALLSLGFGINFLDWLSIPIPSSEYLIVRIGIVLLLTAICYAVVMAVSLSALALVSRTLVAAGTLGVAIAEKFDMLLTLAVEYGWPLLLRLLKLPFWPVARVCAYLYGTYIAPRLERRRQEYELRRLYDEVRNHYASFEDFRRAFEGEPQDKTGGDRSERESGPEQNQAPTPDKFAEACRVLGLSPDGSFTVADLKQRFHTLMKAVHPDLAGPTTLATQINEARDIIKTRKGWK